MAGSHEDGVDRIAGGALEVISLESPIGLGVADDWLDGISSAQW